MPDECKLCPQCEENAKWNEAGGYKEAAQECRDYCKNGHKELLNVQYRQISNNDTDVK